jgi:hypothetical protein
MDVLDLYVYWMVLSSAGDGLNMEFYCLMMLEAFSILSSFGVVCA